jgi:opacity protein-like surface antigen
MKRRTLTITAAAATIALAAAAFAAPSIAHGPGGGAYQGGPAAQGQYGPGMMGHMGYGMMGQGQGWGGGMMGQGGRRFGHMGPSMMGYGPGAHGDCPAAQAAQGKDVTVDGVTKLLEHRLAMWGNDRLKLGEVSEQGEDAIVGEIVTQDGSLVERLVFDRHSGRVIRSE